MFLFSFINFGYLHFFHDIKDSVQNMTCLVYIVNYKNCESETLVQLRSFKYVVKCPLRHGNVQKEIDTETKKSI